MNTSFWYALIAATLGGAVPVLAKFGLEAFPSFTLNLIRFFFASLCLLPFVYGKLAFNTSFIKKLILISLVGSANPLLLFIALNFTTASVAPLIYASVPIMVALFTTYKGVRLSKKQWLGVSIGFVGVATVVLLPILQKNSLGSLWGNILIMIAAVSFFVYSELSKKIQTTHTVSPLVLTFFLSICSLLISLPFGLVAYITNGDSLKITLFHTLTAILNGVLGTALFYVVYQKSLQINSTLSATLFVFLQPIATTLFAFFILQEHITPLFIGGGILAVIGAKLASTKSSGNSAENMREIK